MEVRMKKEKHYYVSGHTRIGFYSVLPQLSKEFECLYVLKGLSMKQENDFLCTVAEMFKEAGETIDYFHSPNDNNYVEGVRIPAKKLAVISNEIINKIDSRELSEQRIVFLHFTKAQRNEKKAVYYDKITQLERERDYHYQCAYKYFAQAKEHHNKKEDIYLSAMDFKKADAVAARLSKAFFSNRKKSTRQGDSEKIFFGAATPKGAVHFIEELTASLKRRYIIKGRSGSGKSTLMRRIGKEASERGMSVTYFLCGFDPSSVDMIIIEELNIAIIDGTAPHVIDPTRETDKVIDMFELCIDPTIEDTRMEEINECEKKYKAAMQAGTEHLKKAQEIQSVIDDYMEYLYDKEKLTQLSEDAFAKIINAVQA